MPYTNDSGDSRSLVQQMLDKAANNRSDRTNEMGASMRNINNKLTGSETPDYDKQLANNYYSNLTSAVSGSVAPVGSGALVGAAEGLAAKAVPAVESAVAGAAPEVEMGLADKIRQAANLRAQRMASNGLGGIEEAQNIGQNSMYYKNSPFMKTKQLLNK